MLGEGNTKGRWLWMGLAAAPFVFTAVVVSGMYFRFPFSDAWSLAPLLDQFYEGELTLGEFWAPYHGHRLFFARIIMVPLAYATNWNHGWEVSLNFVLGIGIFATFIWTLRRSAHSMGRSFPYALVPLLSLLVFNLNQWCNWAWGWQFLVFESVLFSVLSLAFITAAALTPWRTAAAVACAIIASYSFGTGMAVWPAGFVVLLMRGFWGSVPWRYVAAWFVAGVVVFIGFIVNFDHPLQPYEESYMTLDPLALIRYTFVFIGANAAYFRREWLALPVGVVAIAATAYLHWRLLRGERAPYAAIAPATALMLFALSAAALSGFGRISQLGIGQAIAPRYTTVSMLFWVGLIWLVHVWSRREQTIAKTIAATTLVLLAGLWILAMRQGYYDLDEFDKVYTPEVRRLVVEDMDDAPARLNPYRRPLAEEIKVLKSRELSVFRPEAVRFWERVE